MLKHYLSSTDLGKLAWLINFNNKIVATYGEFFSLTITQLLTLLNDTNAFKYISQFNDAALSSYHASIAFKDDLRDGLNETVAHPFPTFVLPGVVPVAVPYGIFVRATELVNIIKTHSKYTSAIGKDLNIIGADSIVDWSTAQPQKVKAKSSAGQIAGGYLKGQADGARIECKRGSETVFTTVTNVSKSKFIDERPNLIPNLPEKRQYRVWFLKGDKVVGIVSTIVTITVEG